MLSITKYIEDALEDAFIKSEIDKKYLKVVISDRPDLCEFQCNSALSLARILKKSPMEIAEKIISNITNIEIFESITACSPGFINININNNILSDFVNSINESKTFGIELNEKKETIIVDYGGPNIAKPLHVGHLRSAVIGESIKRILKFKNNIVYGDIHIGDYGLQMGLVINEFSKRNPNLVYFDENYKGDYPIEAFFSIKDLEEIYPFASKKSREDEKYYEEALEYTRKLQNGVTGIRKLWEKIVEVSVNDLKRNYENLYIDFDLWLGEASASEYIDELVDYLKENGYAHISDNALVVDVKEKTDKKEIPPCIILKSDGASLYTTSDLATLIQRRKDFNPDKIVYVVDQRQNLHFEQVFRCAKKTKIVDEKTKLIFVAFGTMNGKDNRPFKTKDGGNVSLESLINDTYDAVTLKFKENKEELSKEEEENAKIVAIAALKYADLSNQASKDYIFDINKFLDFEGNTGPYILYTIVRLKSLIEKYNASRDNIDDFKIMPAKNKQDKELQIVLSRFNIAFDEAYEELAPHKLCSYIYELSNKINSFYHNNKVLNEEDEKTKRGWVCLLNLAKNILEIGIDLLGFKSVDRM